MRRVYEHKNKLVKGFSSKYNIQYLVYYESTSSVYSAIEREKQIKGWLRAKKIALISSMNPKWKDLSEEWYPKSDDQITEESQNLPYDQERTDVLEYQQNKKLK